MLSLDQEFFSACLIVHFLFRPSALGGLKMTHIDNHKNVEYRPTPNLYLVTVNTLIGGDAVNA